ncbi:spermidine dehydrogenase, partial [Gammaproteobacteria bacterium]|nr:spermidine dehydrogenase [Gammaproteobacteria bacterium]
MALEAASVEAMDMFPKRRRPNSQLRFAAGLNDEALKVMLPYARSVWAVNIDVISAANARSFGYPGFAGLDLTFEVHKTDNAIEEPNIFHFPDGNATVARLLVKKLIPSVSFGDSVEDIVTARFDYGRLDQPSSAARIRLNSSVVRARHIADNLSNPVSITYVRGDEAYNVTANQVVMAGYNALIPRLCPEMPEAQKNALANCVRAPLVYTNVLIRNWRSLAELGVRRAYCPGCYHHSLA